MNKIDRDGSHAYIRLQEIFDEVKEGCRDRIDIFGTVKFKIAYKKIDGKEYRVAKIKGNTITIKHTAVTILPKSALKYIIAHELAHVLVKDHNERFWDIVRMIYPKYNMGKRVLERYRDRI
ncbi:MAG: M48 family metallopeptidase [Candidatus Nitrosocaldus sp.]